MRTTIFIDWDGTLADTLSVHYKASCHVFTSVGLTPPTPNECWRNLKPPFVHFYHSRGVKLSYKEIGILYNGFFNERIARPTLFYDAFPFLMALSQKARIVILSGAEETRIHRHVALTGVSAFADEVHAGVENKADIFRRLTSKYRGEFISISDLAHDTKEAIRCRVRAVGLTRGVSTWLEHKKAGARVIVSGLSALVPILKNGTP